MKIVLISQYFFPEQFSNNSIAKSLFELGHEIHVVTCVPNYPAGKFFHGYSNKDKREEEWNGIKIHRAWTLPRGQTSISLIRNYLTFPFSGFWTAIKKIPGRADVSFVSMPSPLFQALAGIFLRWFKNTPTVYWVQDLWPESATYTLGIKNPLILKPLTWFCGWIYRQADLILVQSAAFPPMIERFGVDPERIRLFPNSAPDLYEPILPMDAPNEAKMVPQGGFRLMFAGNIGESQDFDTLIECADILKENEKLTWVIVGSGRDLDRVRRVLKDRNLEDRFVFLGRHPEERMPKFFAHADAMLVSLKKNPIFALTVPYKVQCYLACGKPIIGSIDGEGSRIIEAANAGLCAPASEPRRLAEVILNMMNMTSGERQTMGANARSFYRENYSAEKVNADLSRWLREASKAVET